MENLNISKEFEKEKSLRIEYEWEKEVCEKELNETKKDCEDDVKQVESLSNDLDRCEASKTSLSNSQTNYNECMQELSDCNRSKNNLGMILLALGVGIGYVIWGRKKHQGPSEQAEAGYSSDQVNYRGSEKDLPTFEDGPKE